MGIISTLKNILNFLAPKGKKPKFTSAVIVAGGSSTRMGNGISKQLTPLCGIPVVIHTLLAFENCPLISEIIVVAKADELEHYEKFKKDYNITKLKKAVVGGDSRQRSVEKGFAAVSQKCEFGAIHDGARCLITADEIAKVCEEAYVCNAATAAVKATDTIKIATDNGFIESTPDRNKVWHAQTPQVFFADLYRAAVAVGNRDKITVTDDCSLVEHIDHPIKLVECSRNNIKITTARDLAFASSVIKSRVKKEES